jgi:hypothetical protein
VDESPDKKKSHRDRRGTAISISSIPLRRLDGSPDARTDQIPVLITIVLRRARSVAPDRSTLGGAASLPFAMGVEANMRVL